MKRQWLFGSMLGFPLLLAGCGALQLPPTSGKVSVSALPSPKPAQTSAKPPAPKRTLTMAPTRKTTPQPPSNQPPSAGNSAGINLIGMEAARAREILGEPASEEAQPPGQVWHYRSAECRLDVSFFPNVQTRVFHVLSYEVTGHDGSDQTKRECNAAFDPRAWATRAGGASAAGPPP